MYKKLMAICITVLLGACSTLDSSSDFYDAIDSVEEKHSSLIVKAKPYTANTTAKKGKNVMKNVLTLTAGVSKREELTHNFKFNLDVTYFKSYQLFTEVSVEGVERPLKEYAPIVESCGDHCTNIQFLTFNIEPNEFSSAVENGLSFDLKTKKDLTVIQFDVPAGYFKAIQEEITLANNSPQKAQPITVAAVSTPDIATEEHVSKPQEMTSYWYEQSTPSDQKTLIKWAFQNRTKTEGALLKGSKSVEMASYWFDRATVEEKKLILAWLIEQE